MRTWTREAAFAAALVGALQFYPLLDDLARRGVADVRAEQLQVVHLVLLAWLGRFWRETWASAFFVGSVGGQLLVLVLRPGAPPPLAALVVVMVGVGVACLVAARRCRA